MAEQFYTILTKFGKSEVTRAAANGSKVDFKFLALGDGNGRYYNPHEDQLKLVKEVYRRDINSISIDTVNPNWIKMTVIIPATVGGFMIREVGIFDSGNNLLAVGKYPETYKPIIENGSSKDLTISMILEVSNAEVVNLVIDPFVVIATKYDVNKVQNGVDGLRVDSDNIRTDLDNHISSLMPHIYRDLKSNKIYRYGYQTSAEGKPQIIFEEE